MVKDEQGSSSRRMEPKNARTPQLPSLLPYPRFDGLHARNDDQSMLIEVFLSEVSQTRIGRDLLQWLSIQLPPCQLFKSHSYATRACSQLCTSSPITGSYHMTSHLTSISTSKVFESCTCQISSTPLRATYDSCFVMTTSICLIIGSAPSISTMNRSLHTTLKAFES